MMSPELILKRREYRPDGIFGQLSLELELLAQTLEHAYPIPGGSPLYAPKVPAGKYVCRRGPHRLHGMQSDFETFEIEAVPGHSNILFHWGNYNQDSQGCVLLGKTLARVNGSQIITASRETWQAFMRQLAGSDQVQLTVLD